MNKMGKIDHLFLLSALTEDNPYNTTRDVLTWIQEQNKKITVDVSRIPFKDMSDWVFDADGNLRHKTGRFFSIEGISVNTNYGKIPEWQQPIINQPEIGFLGIITKEVDGILYFLLQAKVEPGNVNNVQLSPTLQATKSNYSQVHKGNKPLYLEYFQNVRPEQILLDQLQSEQGARFLKKRNRNIIIKIDEEIPVYDNFVWVTLAQIKTLSHYDNVVNMDTRTVISGIHFKCDDTLCPSNPAVGFELLNEDYAKHSIVDILSWMTSLKCKYELEVTSVPLKDIPDWKRTTDCIEHIANKYFKVIATQVAINNREVKTWSQPLVQPIEQGLTAFIIKKINGVYHFLVQAKVEVGNFDILEMAPSVQCITANYRAIKNQQPYVDYVLNVNPSQIWVDTLQSEEGGRFYQEQNRNMIIEAGDDFDDENIPENYKWITFSQLMLFLHFNNYLNIQSRSLISLINFI